MHLNLHKTAVSVATFVAVVNLVWAVLVGLGWGQDVASYAARIHMVSPATRVASFDLTNAIMLILVSAIVGYCLGWLFAKVWNMSK